MAGAVVAVSAVGRAAGRYRLRVHSLSPLAFRPCLVSQSVCVGVLVERSIGRLLCLLPYRFSPVAHFPSGKTNRTTVQ